MSLAEDSLRPSQPHTTRTTVNWVGGWVGGELGLASCVCSNYWQAIYIPTAQYLMQPMRYSHICISIIDCLIFAAWYYASTACVIMWCLSVMLMNVVETNMSSGSHTILVFPCHMLWQYSDGDPLMGALNAGVVWWCGIWLHRVLWTVRLPSAIYSAAMNRGKLLRLVAGKWRRLFLTGDDTEVFMIRSQLTLCQRQQSSI